MAVGIEDGELTRTVSFKEPTMTRNSEGGKEKSFASVFNAKAKVESTNFRTGVTVPALLNTDTIHIRYSSTRSAITKDWLVNYDSLDHVIHSIEFLGDQRNEFIRLTVKAVE